MKTKTQIQFCNAASGVTLLSYCNEISIGEDGWAMIAPFGDHPSEALIPTGDRKLKRIKSIQRINKTNGDEMVAEFHNSRKGILKFLRGVNIYVGHPDMPGLENRYPDKEPKGVFADMETRTDGVYGLPVFTNEGSEIVEKKKLRAFSGRLVDSVADGESNGLPVYCPTKIQSVGLTNHPHLPVHFFNSDDTLADTDVEAEKNNKTKQTMKKKLIAVCGLLGIQFANEAADDAQTEAALDQVKTKIEGFATTTKTIKQKLLGLCGKIGIQFANEEAITDPAATLAQVEEKIITLNTDLTASRTQFTNERNSRVGDLLAAALQSGRITAADKSVWEGRLKVDAQFANEMTALAALKPVVKTASVITLSLRGKEQQIDLNNGEQRTQFVNEVLSEIATENKLNPTRDAQRILNIAHQRHPALFKDTPHVEVKMPGRKK